MTSGIAVLTETIRDINAAHGACRESARTALEHAARAGQLLLR